MTFQRFQNQISLSGLCGAAHLLWRNSDLMSWMVLMELACRFGFCVWSGSVPPPSLYSWLDGPVIWWISSWLITLARWVCTCCPVMFSLPVVDIFLLDGMVVLSTTGWADGEPGADPDLPPSHRPGHQPGQPGSLLWILSVVRQEICVSDCSLSRGTRLWLCFGVKHGGLCHVHQK